MADDDFRVKKGLQVEGGSLAVEAGDLTVSGSIQVGSLHSTFTELVQDTVGAMVTGNTETNIAVTYQDGDGTLDFVSTDTDTNTNQLTTFTLTGDSGSNQTIAHGNTLDIEGGTGIDTVVGATDKVTVTLASGAALSNLSGGSGSTFLRKDGNWVAPTDTDTTYSVTANGGIGLSGTAFSLDVDGMTDIGAALVAADLMIVDDGAGGTNRKATMTRLATFMQSNLTFTTNTDVDVSVANLKTRLAGGFGSNAVTIGDSTDVVTIGNDLVITGDLTVSGATTSVNTATLNVSDNIVVLNNDETGTPSQNAGIEVERGTSTNVLVRWNEGSDRWEFTNDGSTYYNIPLSTEYTANVGDITGVTAGVGLSGGGSSGAVTLTLDMSELTDMTQAVNSAQDELIILDNGADRRKLISEIPLSAFNNDSGFTTNTGDMTGVDISAGTGISVSQSNTGSGSYTATITNSSPNTDVDVSVANLKTRLAGGFGSNAVTIGDSDDVVTIGNDLIVTGDLTVSGDTTTVNTATLNVSDNIVVLNNDESGTPSQNAGIEVERGTSTNVLVRWNEGSDRWEFTNDGSTYYNIPLSTEYTANVGDITGVTAGTGLSGGGSSGGVTLALDFSELTDKTSDIVAGTEFILQDGSTESRKAASEIKLSLFNNDSGWTANTGDITGVTAGTGLSGGGSSGGVTLNVSALTVSELAAAALQTSGEAFGDNDTSLMTSAAIQDKIAAQVEAYSYTTNTGDITAVTAGAGMTGGASSGAATLNVIGGTGIDVAADAVSVDVSDFMTNGSNNRLVTATGTDAMNAESTLTYDGTTLKPEAASGTNAAGTSVTIGGGQGTGSGAGGFVYFQTADGAGSGTSANSLTTKMTLADDGKVGIGTATPSYPLHVVGAGYISSDLTVAGDLTVSGTTTTVDTTNLLVSDNIVVLNNDVTGTPSENAGIEIERGTSANVSVRWNEGNDRWEFTNDGTTYYNMLTSSSPGGADGQLQYNNSGTLSGLDYVKRETSGGYEGLALGSTAPGLVTTQGAYNLKLSTNTGTNSGIIEITDGADGDINLTPEGEGSVRIHDTGTNPGGLRVGSSVNNSLPLSVIHNTTSTSGYATGIQVIAGLTSGTRGAGFGSHIEFRSGEGEYTGYLAGRVGTKQIGVSNANFDLHIEAQGTGQVVINDAYRLPAAVTGTNNYVLTAQTDGTTAWAATATSTPTAITVADTTDTTSFVALFESATGDLGPKTDAGLTYNAGTGMLTATGLTGPLTGNASSATNATNATNVTTAAENSSGDWFKIPFVASAAATQQLKTDSGLTYRPSANKLSISGDISLTGNIILEDGSGYVKLGGSNSNALRFYDDDSSHYAEIKQPSTIAANYTLTLPTTDGGTNEFLQTNGSGVLTWAAAGTNATTVTITDNENTNENNAIIFSAGADTDGGNLGLEQDHSGLTYNPSTGTVTATTFVGALTGNVSGNLTGVTTLFGSGSATAKISSSGAQDLVLTTNTNAGWTEPYIQINDSDAGNLYIVPGDDSGKKVSIGRDATSKVQINSQYYLPQAVTGTTGHVLTGNTDGTTSWAAAGTNATTVTITDNESTNENNAIIFSAGADTDGGNLGLEQDHSGLTYNPSSGTVTATTFVGALTGAASSATSATTATHVAGGALGSIPYQTGSGATSLLAGNTVATKKFITQTGNGSVSAAPTWGVLASGDIPDNAADTSGTATLATTVTITDNESTNENNLIAFVADAGTATGAHGLEMDGTLTYNPSTGTVTATTFVGALTGAASSATTANTATNITAAADAANEDQFITFLNTAGTGAQQVLYDSNSDLKYNPYQNKLTIGNTTTIYGTVDGGGNGSWDSDGGGSPAPNMLFTADSDDVSVHNPIMMVANTSTDSSTHMNVPLLVQTTTGGAHGMIVDNQSSGTQSMVVTKAGRVGVRVDPDASDPTDGYELYVSGDVKASTLTLYGSSPATINAAAGFHSHLSLGYSSGTTLTVADTSGFPSSGNGTLDPNGTPDAFAYTGKTSTTLTGCSGISGSKAKGIVVEVSDTARNLQLSAGSAAKIVFDQTTNTGTYLDTSSAQQTGIVVAAEGTTATTFQYAHLACQLQYVVTDDLGYVQTGMLKVLNNKLGSVAWSEYAILDTGSAEPKYNLYALDNSGAARISVQNFTGAQRTVALTIQGESLVP